MSIRKFITLPLLATLSFTFLDINAANQTQAKAAKEAAVLSKVSDLDPQILRNALNVYYRAAQRNLNRKKYLTVVNFTKPSNQERTWIYDMDHNRLIHNTWVAHGINSREAYETHFSNSGRSHQGSLGLYQSRVATMGDNSLSLSLAGLAPGYNDNAMSRAVVWPMEPGMSAQGLLPNKALSTPLIMNLI